MIPDWLTVSYSYRTLLTDILLNESRFLHLYQTYQLFRSL
jgi:hypothetical protein